MIRCLCMKIEVMGDYTPPWHEKQEITVFSSYKKSVAARNKLNYRYGLIGSS